MMNMQSNLQMMPLLQQKQMQQKQQQAQFQTYLSQMQSLGSMLHTLSYGTPLSELNKLHAGVKAQFEANNHELGGRLKNAITQVKEMRKNIDLDNERYATKNPDNSQSEDDEEFKDALDMLEDEIAYNSQGNGAQNNQAANLQLSMPNEPKNPPKSESNQSVNRKLQSSARQYLDPTQMPNGWQPPAGYPAMYPPPYPPYAPYPPPYAYPGTGQMPVPDTSKQTSKPTRKQKKKEESESSEEERPKKKMPKVRQVVPDDDDSDSVSALNSPKLQPKGMPNMQGMNPMAAMGNMQGMDPMMQNMMMLMMMNNMKQGGKKKKKKDKSKKKRKEEKPQVFFHPQGMPIPPGMTPGQPLPSRRDNDLRKATFSMTESMKSSRPGFSRVQNI